MTFEDKLKKKIEREAEVDTPLDPGHGAESALEQMAFERGANLLAPLLVECEQFLKYTAQTDISETPPDFLWLQRWRDGKKQYAQSLLNKLEAFVRDGQDEIN